MESYWYVPWDLDCRHTSSDILWQGLAYSCIAIPSKHGPNTSFLSSVKQLNNSCLESTCYIEQGRDMWLSAFFAKPPWPLHQRAFSKSAQVPLTTLLCSTPMTILHWSMLYPGYCFLGSHRREPYLTVFCSSFFAGFSTHGQFNSTAQTFFPLWSTNRASILLALTQVWSA